MLTFQPPTDVFVLLDIDAADAKGGEETVERLVTRETFEELAKATDGGDEVLLRRGVVDECVERSVLVHVPGGVEGAVDPLLGEVEDGGGGVMVCLIALRTIAYLNVEMVGGENMR